MPTPLPLPRLLVSGHTAEGRSTFISDGEPHRVRTVEERPGYRVSNLWALFDSPAAINDPDRVAEVAGLAPPPRGNLIRIIDYPPEPSAPKLAGTAAPRLVPISKRSSMPLPGFCA